ncbi:5-oxoprolinase subunit PxpB [Pseudomonas sp. gcc21]|uniref:5-oxoprolinase subunit PxpB n=1 Tax=Pseudomonas sp. gcc21 TaxID=2726989 RepID=UPI0014527D82|nr:5-oxoprolinase subunit PxpB [Pseudomonas sp. gcc21]QJD59795.1 5-oxoprolinase subunit PxpB [Pseudomonas sp. gcc21]
MKLRIERASVDTLMIRLFDRIEEGNMPWLLAAAQRLRSRFGNQLIDLVPSYTTLMLHYDLRQLDEHAACTLVTAALEALQPLPPEQAGRRHEIAVWYDKAVGPDLGRLSDLTGLRVDQVIALHSGHEYQVFALGFAPGFAYMGLLDEQLATPRLSTPRKRVPAGSVAIAERQTAAYPLASPGGWNLVGRTPAPLFDRDREGYSLLQPGDRVRFVPVERAEFVRWGGDDTPVPGDA